ncbi:Rap/ran-GAP protein [Mortierella alpina]|nr:Rap/ran-GAP protein [Mortierella alpina]
MEQSKSLASFPSEYDTHTRSSASLLPKHSMTTSYLYSTAANHNAYGPKPTVDPTKITAPASRATTGARNPSLPHLEPRSAVADYSPSVHYKRQRSMSLQDADLLTADQFIALMPDDLTPKRRFSSEEALSENPLWHASQRTKSTPIPDSPTALCSLLEMLRAKCDEVLHSVVAGSVTSEDKKGRTMTVGMTGKVTIRVQEATVDHITTTAWSEFPSEAQDRAGSGQHLGNESSASTAEGVRPECEVDFDSTMAMDITIEMIGHVVARMIEVMAKYTSVNHLTAVYIRLDDLRLKVHKALPMKTYCKRSSLDASQRHSEHKETDAGAVDGPTTKSDPATGNNETIGMASNEPERLHGNQVVDQPIQLHLYQHQSGGSNDTDSSHSHAYMDQLNAVEDYIQSLLKAAESTMADYLQVYSRMFVLPTTGYRIEGRGDLKRTSEAPSRLDPQVALTSVKGTTSNTPPSSLLTRATTVQGIIAANAIDHSSIAGKYGDESLEPCPLVSPSTTAEVPKGSALVSGGMLMARVQSMPESKDEWRNTSPSTPLSNPTVVGGGIGGIGATGAGAGVTGAGGPDMSMLGEYSKEHMGHEAYYYRNWFLGREHRTFVGQVDGLGTVIISIIKDMVVPSEARPTPLANHNSGPMALSASSSSNYSSGSIGTAFGSGASLGSNFNAETHPSTSGVFNTPGGATSSSTPTNKQAAAATGTIPSATASIALSLPVHNSTTSLNSNKDSSSTARWQYRCILRQKDVDSLRITLPEPDPGPLNNLARRVGKPQWKTILQSIHPAITQQAASKLKKVQNNQQFEKELATFDETMLRFNYKFGVLLVLPGQTREEDWFSNQMESSTNFQAFLEHGVLGQKVALKGSPLCIIPLNRLVGEAGEYSYYDTWGEGFEIMYHVSTLLPYNTADRQQIQRKRHIGNDIVCIVFVDGDQPFVPNAIKSQFLHIFVVIRQIELSDGINGYSVAIACDEQVPDFGPPLPEPPVFKTPQELRAFLLCKMINGENAAYKAPRLIKPHQRARSGMLDNLVAKANTLAKDKDSDRKQLKQQKAATTPFIATSTLHGYSTTMTTTSAPTTPAMRPTTSTIYCCQCHQQHLDDSFFRDHATGVQQCPVLPSSLHQPAYPCQPGHPLDCERAHTFSTFPTATPSYSPGDETRHLMRFMKANTISGTRASSRNSLTLGSELKGSLFKHRRRSSNVDGSKLEAMLKSNAIDDNDSEKEWISASGLESASRAQARNFNVAHQTHAQSLPCSPMLTPSAVSQGTPIVVVTSFAALLWTGHETM